MAKPGRQEKLKSMPENTQQLRMNVLGKQSDMLMNELILWVKMNTTFALGVLCSQ